MESDACIVGGGPAGIILGFLFARAGVRVVVLEKHESFLRDFRGDTVHPSTLDLMDQLGLGAQMRALPHRKVCTLRFRFADRTCQIADFSRLRVAHPYIMFVPQWDFLELVAREAAKLPCFTLLRSHEAIDVIRGEGRTLGVIAKSGAGSVEIRARLTVAADGRQSTVRERLGLPVREFGAPMDVLWFRLPREGREGQGVEIRVGPGRLILGIDRGDYWQHALVIRKGGYDQIVAAGLPAFRRSIAELAPELAARTEQLTQWDDIKVLSVQLNRAERWHLPGALLIGDAAHAMSPIGGVGINLAIQDAVAAARLLAAPLLADTLSEADLARVQERRNWPAAATQSAQRVIQQQMIDRFLSTDRPVRAPLPMRMIDAMPFLQRLAARAVGVGVRPETL